MKYEYKKWSGKRSSALTVELTHIFKNWRLTNAIFYNNILRNVIGVVYIFVFTLVSEEFQLIF